MFIRWKYESNYYTIDILKVMEERKLTEFRPKLDMNSTKMLNGKTLEPPHSEIVDKLLRKSLVKSEKNLLYSKINLYKKKNSHLESL